MAHPTIGLKAERIHVFCWCSLTMPRGRWYSCASGKARAFSATLRQQKTIFSDTASPSPSTAICFANGIFRVNLPSASSGDALTQFGRAMQELDIQIICANTPQAKGRVERVNQTLQDRLVKELRLQRISTAERANAYTPEFMADFNRRFSLPPANPEDAHRPLLTSHHVEHIFTVQTPRTVTQNLTLQYNKQV